MSGQSRQSLNLLVGLGYALGILTIVLAVLDHRFALPVVFILAVLCVVLAEVARRLSLEKLTCLPNAHLKDEAIRLQGLLQALKHGTNRNQYSGLYRAANSLMQQATGELRTQIVMWMVQELRNGEVDHLTDIESQEALTIYTQVISRYLGVR